MIGIGIANAIGFNRNNKDSIRIPTAIKNSMVLWYDIAKQKATNESMAENPTLKDLSGNGNDATCYNFGWSGMSGIGGYNPQYVINNKYIMDFTADNDYKATITKIKSPGPISYSLSMGKVTAEIPQCKVKISGMTNEIHILYRYIAEQGNDTLKAITIVDDGIYTLPKQYVPTLNGINTPYWIGLGFLQDSFPDSCNITIEFLPLYPNALVSDGVDDYISATGIPLFDINRGYTIIAKRKSLRDLETQRGSIVSKNKLFSSGHGCVMEGRYMRNNVRGVYANSFGSQIEINYIEDDISWQTSNSYNGTAIQKGDVADTCDILTMIKLDADSNDYYGQYALYAVALFDRDLTDEEIQWVKNNLMQ